MSITVKSMGPGSMIIKLFGNVWEQFWNQYGIGSEKVLKKFGITMESIWNQYGIGLGNG